MAIIGACLPLLPPVYRRLRHGRVDVTRGSSSGKGPSSGSGGGGSLPLSSLKGRCHGGAAGGTGDDDDDRDFYRLENGYECDPATPAHRKHSQTVGVAALRRHSSEGEDDDDSDPGHLGGIVVKKEFIWNGPNPEPHGRG